MPLPPASEPDCPFCRIATTYPPAAEAVPVNKNDAEGASPLAYLLLSTSSVIAFLDHAPISRGHVLLATRQHRLKLSDASIEEGQAVGAWLGILSRAVVGTVAPPETATHAGDEGIGDWNVVQNNGWPYAPYFEDSAEQEFIGAKAAQVVPHVHFHIIPRAGDVPEVKARSWTVFGRGQREDLDDEDAVSLCKQMREAIHRELENLKLREGEGAVRLLLGQHSTRPNL